MRKKLEIGDEIVIYPESGHYYTSLETKNGHYTQDFKSFDIPRTLTAVFIGREEGKDGRWYEKYTLKTVQGRLKIFELRGKVGFYNLIEELNAISNILQGKAEDGRRILYSRSINIEDVNKILGVVVDYKNKIVYQKNNPSKNINICSKFGTKRLIFPEEVKMCGSIDSEFIEVNELKYTAYGYRIEDLKVPEKLKEIVILNNPYFLASRFVQVYDRKSCFCLGEAEEKEDGISYVGVTNTLEWCGPGLNSKYGFWTSASVRPVFYLEVDKEQLEAEKILEEIKKQQEKITEIKKDISNLEENLKKEEKKLEKMIEEALKLV